MDAQFKKKGPGIVEAPTLLPFRAPEQNAPSHDLHTSQPLAVAITSTEAATVPVRNLGAADHERYM